jgi:L-asparaginase
LGLVADTVTAVQTVAVLSLGGTISMTSPRDGGPVVPALGSAELVRAVPGLEATGVELVTVDVRRLPGSGITMAVLDEAVRIAAEHVDAGAAGVVVTQGTDTIEETSFALDLRWDRDAPLVVTGAMRHPAMAGADGPANLLAAVRTAASADARGLGCVVVMADEIHAARWVRKTHTTGVTAFGSPATGPLGELVEGRAVVNMRPARLPATPPPVLGDVRVALVTAVLDDDGTLLPALAGRADGLVVAALGVGHVPVPWVEPLTDLVTQMPVVLTSRIGAGPVLTSTYGYPGSEADLIDRGLVPAGALDPYKARVLLHRLLAGGTKPDDVAPAFARFANLATSSSP